MHVVGVEASSPQSSLSIKSGILQLAGGGGHCCVSKQSSPSPPDGGFFVVVVSPGSVGPKMGPKTVSQAKMAIFRYIAQMLSSGARTGRFCNAFEN